MTMLNSSTQKAGENSVQIQVQGDFIQQGITEERALAIAQDAAQKAIAEFSEESHALGLQRIADFDQILVERLSHEDGLNAFKDPGFQVVLRKAQIGAASTEREDDYKMLSELLADRVQNGSDRPSRAGIDRAIEVVGQIDPPALTALTTLQVLNRIVPMAGLVGVGLQQMENVFAQIIGDSELPFGRDWMDHLDILDAVRLDPVQSFKKFDDYYPSIMSGYVASGVDSDSDEHTRSVLELAAVQLNFEIVEHELRPGFLRLPFPRLSALSARTDEMPNMTPEKKALILRNAEEVYGLNETGDTTLASLLIERARELPYSSRVCDWWNQLPVHAYATAVGRVLVRGNAQRCDPDGMTPSLLT